MLIGEDWVLQPAESAGMDGAVLAGLKPHFTAWREANLHAALILRHGKLVLEEYFTGDDTHWSQPLPQTVFNAATRHDIRSVSKSVTSLLFGIAVDRGWIKSLDQPVFALFPEHAALADAAKDRITLRHVLTMSAGFAWDENIPYSDPANSERKLIVAPDRVRHVLEQPMARPAGATYNYNGGLTLLLAAIVERLSGQGIDGFAQQALFDPLGIRAAGVEWNRYPDGAANPVSGLRLRPRDMARIGQMVLDRGVWQGRAVVSPGWITESLEPQVNGAGLFFYGFQWWLGRSLVNRREIRWAAAFGHGGQRIFIAPELGIVVVVTAGLYGDPVLMNVVGEVVLRRYALAAARG
ncbi:MAG: serine hydrolase [Ferrovibrio sp.]|nr:serine hydrolase [Ferrovibrio sp.]